MTVEIYSFLYTSVSIFFRVVINFKRYSLDQGLPCI